ncbi:MAG: TonB-dependent receptor plug domain-containing protein [Opitutales bacterium]
MKNQANLFLRWPAFALLLTGTSIFAGGAEPPALPVLYVGEQQTANIRPVAGYNAPVSNLEFEPRVDLQTRNMAEAQGDVAIRGGIFENTGFRIGTATIIDPQTGHYSAELPIPSEMLTGPEVLTGVENAVYGFNSSVGTISYKWAPVYDGGSLTAGGGDHDLNFQHIRQGWTKALDEKGRWQWGAELDYSRSESAGTRQFGDHDFDRFSGRLQLLGPHSQTDFFAGYQSKNFSWPNLYTPANFAPFIGAVETEELKTRLFLLNHLHEYGGDNFFEASLFHRRHTDDYLLDARAFDFPISHETKVTALAFSGRHAFTENIGFSHAGQLTTDSIESTDLEQGDFTSRDYVALTLLPEWKMRPAKDERLRFQAGARYDNTNRDSSEISPIAAVTWNSTYKNGLARTLQLSYAESTQVPGYTAIGGSETTGLFRSNHDLDRESARNLELRAQFEQTKWSVESALFYRWDDDLVDWTFNEADPTAREANNVDIRTLGFETIISRSWSDFELIAGYTYLHKEEDFGDAAVDGSFYALNFPEHRVTFGAIWQPHDTLEVRIDNEWRSQKENALRQGDDEALLTHLGISFYPPVIDRMEVFLAADNLWDKRFQEVPGTPGRGDQYSAGITYRW